MRRGECLPLVVVLTVAEFSFSVWLALGEDEVDLSTRELVVDNFGI